MPTIKESWDVFKEKMIPNQASEIQVRMMRMSFYAGATTVMLVNEMLSQKDFDEDEGCRILEGLAQECHEFMKENIA